MDEAALDVGVVMAQLRAEVRAAQGLQHDTTRHLALGVDTIALTESVAEVEALRAVSIHWPLMWHTPRQRFEVFVKRLVRRALRFYLEPIVQQQNTYNAAVARAVSLLYQAQQALANEVARLQVTPGSETTPNEPR